MFKHVGMNSVYTRRENVRNYFYVNGRFLMNRAYSLQLSKRMVKILIFFLSKTFYQNMRERALMKLVSDVWMHWKDARKLLGCRRWNESNVIKMKTRMWSDNVEFCQTRYDKMFLMNGSEEQISSLKGWKDGIKNIFAGCDNYNFTKRRVKWMHMR